MKKVGIITTGGTIGSVLSGSSVAVEAGMQRVAREIEQVKDRLGCAVVVESPFNKNSEDMTPQDWGLVLKAIESFCATDVDGIVVTHGTDTMAYTVAAADVCAGLWNKVVCFTGAFYAPDHPQSDTSLNLTAAIECALSEQFEAGVYLAFRAAEAHKAVVIRGSSVIPMAFDAQSFAGLYQRKHAEYCVGEGFSFTAEASEAVVPRLPINRLPEPRAMQVARKKLAYIHMHPGVDLDFLQAVTHNRELLIVDLYHSGTGPAAEDGDFLEFLLRKSDSLHVVTGGFPAEYIDVPYVSSVRLVSHGASILSDLPSHLIYTYALIGLAAGMTAAELVHDLNSVAASSFVPQQ